MEIAEREKAWRNLAFWWFSRRADRGLTVSGVIRESGQALESDATEDQRALFGDEGWSALWDTTRGSSKWDPLSPQWTEDTEDITWLRWEPSSFVEQGGKVKPVLTRGLSPRNYRLAVVPGYWVLWAWGCVCWEQKRAPWGQDGSSFWTRRHLNKVMRKKKVLAKMGVNGRVSPFRESNRSIQRELKYKGKLSENCQFIFSVK